MRQIGDLKVKDVMRKVKSVHPDTKIKELIKTFEKEEVNALAVIDENGNFLGDVHKHDLLKLIVSPKDVSWDEVTGIFGRQVDMGYFAESVKDLMHKHELTVEPDEMVQNAVSIMFKHDLDVIAVTENEKVVGMITELEILEQIYKLNKKRGKA